MVQHNAIDHTGVPGVSSGSVATDTIWNAAGDLAVGSGSDTAARLAIGNVGGRLSRINGAVAWDSDTSFPTAATGDRFYRSDRGLDYYYDGTRWLSMQLFTLPISLRDGALNGVSDTNSESTQGRATVPYATTYDIYIVAFEATTFVGATNDGSNFWTIRWKWGNAAGTVTTIDSYATSGDTQANYTYHIETVGSVLDNTAVGLFLTVQDTGTVGTLVVHGSNVLYRLVG